MSGAESVGVTKEACEPCCGYLNQLEYSDYSRNSEIKREILDHD